MSGRQPRPWRHGLASTPILTTGAVYAGGLVANLADAPPGLLGLGGVAVAATSVTAIGSVARGLNGAQTGYTTTCAAAITGWPAYAVMSSPWTWDAAGLLAVGATALGMLWPWYRWSRRGALPAGTSGAAAAGAPATDWEEILERAGHKGVREIGPRVHTRAGYTLRLGLPADGRVRFSTLAAIAALEGIATAARGTVPLRPGALTVEPTDVEGEVLLHVSTLDVLAEVTPLPDDVDPITVNEAFPVGVYEDGEPIELLMRQNSVLIVGMRGSGKSVLLHTVIAQLTRCVDAVVWCIDMGGGATARPWIEPWLDGREGCDRPVLDWVATTPDEAMRMLQAMIRVVDGRSQRLRGKIRPSADLPAIILVTDELPKLMTVMPRAASLVERLLKEGRKTAADLVAGVQRGTVANTGSGEAKSQYDTRIGLKVSEPGETQYVHPGSRVDLSRLPGRGVMYLQGDGVRPIRGRGYYVNDEADDVIPALAAERTHIRPDLDEATIADAGEDYAARWSAERAGHLLYGAPPPAVASAVPVAATTTYRVPPSPTEFLRSVGLPTGPDAPDPREDDYDRGLRELLDGPTAEPEAEPEERPAEPSVSAARARMYELLAEAGEAGASPSELAEQLTREGHETVRQTVAGWLRQDLAEGRVVQPGRGRYRLAG